MDDLQPLITHFDVDTGQALPLPVDLARLYGRLALPNPTGRPAIITNFVSTLDGVVTLAEPGHTGGGEISGDNLTDRAVMGLLRAAASSVLVGATQLRKPPGTLWTPDHIFTPFGQAYAQLRQSLNLPLYPLQVVVSASGNVESSLPIFQKKDLPVLILTSPKGEAMLRSAGMSTAVQVQAIADAEKFTAQQILAAIGAHATQSLILIEGGPNLAALFFAAHLLDELFLTLAPQVAGRDKESAARRMSFVFGQDFAPHNPLWGRLNSLKQAGEHLFLRYRFDAG